MTVPWMTSPARVVDAGHPHRGDARLEPRPRCGPGRAAAWGAARAAGPEVGPEAGDHEQQSADEGERVPARVGLAGRSARPRCMSRMAASPALRMMAKPIGMPASSSRSIQPQPIHRPTSVGGQRPRAAGSRTAAGAGGSVMAWPPARPDGRALRRRTRVTLSSTPQTVTRHSASATILRLILLVPDVRSTKVIGTSRTTQAALQRPPGQVDLEAVALRRDLVQVELAQRVGAERAVAAGGVVDRHAEHEPRVGAAAPGDELAALGPVLGPAARHPAGAQDEVGVPERVEQPRQLLGLVRAVGVHLDDDVVALLQGPGEPGQVGGAEALLARAGA